jgi:hypothetical protein
LTFIVVFFDKQVNGILFGLYQLKQIEKDYQLS